MRGDPECNRQSVVLVPSLARLREERVRVRGALLLSENGLHCGDRPHSDSFTKSMSLDQLPLTLTLFREDVGEGTG